jgi:hypothetical protein
VCSYLFRFKTESTRSRFGRYCKPATRRSKSESKSKSSSNYVCRVCYTVHTHNRPKQTWKASLIASQSMAPSKSPKRSRMLASLRYSACFVRAAFVCVWIGTSAAAAAAADAADAATAVRWGRGGDCSDKASEPWAANCRDIMRRSVQDAATLEHVAESLSKKAAKRSK